MGANEELLVRMRLQGARQLAADAGVAASAIGELGNATTLAGEKAKVTSVEMFGLREGLYALRRYLFWGMTAVGAFGVGIAKLGLNFDNARIEGTTAFTSILGSAQLARTEMNRLTGETYQTGLQLTTLTEAAKQMTGFGFSLHAVNTDLRALGDYAERAHLGVGGFQSLVGVFDQIQSSGRLSSANIRSLTRDGVPALQILRRELHLTGLQLWLLQTGRLAVPASYALPALATGLQARANQLGPSLGQQFGITRAYLASIVGNREQGLFGWITGALGGLNKALAASVHGRSFLDALDPSGHLLLAWNLLTAAVRGVVAPFRLVGDAISYVNGALRSGNPLVLLIGRGLGALARQTWLVTGAVAALTTWWIVSRARLLALWTLEKLTAAWETGYLVVLYGLDAATAAWAAATAVATGAMTALDIAMEANPIGVVALAIVGLGGALYYLVTHLHQARDAWADFVHHLDHPFHLPQILGGGIPHLPTLNLGRYIHLPHLAAGGSITGAGSALVGERGPEMVSLPRGATVQPLGLPGGGLAEAIAAAIAPLLAGVRIAPADVNVDGQRLATIVFDWQQRTAALA